MRARPAKGLHLGPQVAVVWAPGRGRDMVKSMLEPEAVVDVLEDGVYWSQGRDVEVSMSLDTPVYYV